MNSARTFEDAGAAGTLFDQEVLRGSERPPVFLPRREVERRVGLSRSAIYARVARGEFPAPVRDLETATVWWVESEIVQWQRARITARSMGQEMGRNEKAPTSP